MRENYGLCCLWDVNNNCFVASSPDFILCRGTGRTQTEAVAALDAEVQEWIKTGRELGVDVSEELPVAQEQALFVSEPPAPFQENSPEKLKRKERNSLLKALKEALAAAQAAAFSFPLDFTVTLDPCVVRIRGEMTLQTACGARDEILALAFDHNNIIFDLSGVDFIDSYGLALLVEIRKKLRATHASLCIVTSEAKENQVVRVLRLGRFDTIMHVFPSLEEAIAISQQNNLAAS